MRAVGEVEFANRVAAMTASGRYWSIRACAAIVARGRLDRIETLDETLEAIMAAGNGRVRGVRHSGAVDYDRALLRGRGVPKPGLYVSEAFRAGFSRLAKYGLSFDAFLYHPQLSELVDLARQLPDQSIILDHLGVPIGVDDYRDRRQEVFDIWACAMRELADCAKVRVKLGRLGSAV